ncbi:DUF3278 domain-containing protein [Streptococcus sp. S784/96/1]|uniref:DUF3278 domain-containing protein n=1 Tax=Streptococcus sp. S784/96/1 TaxID=2653499 RepID=UPI001386A119|nr:DUF3278 domain-containing protein [Streptococcus sp. S784/96/1]
MKKEYQSKFYYLFLKWFYGIEGDFTTDHELEIQKLSSEVYPFMITVLIGGFLLSMLFYTDLTSWAYLIAVVYPLAYQSSVVQKFGWDKLTVVPSQLKEARRKMFRKTLRMALFYVIVLLLTTVWLWQSGIPQEAGTTFEVYWKIAAPGVMVLYTPIIFMIAFFSNHRKIKVIKE